MRPAAAFARARAMFAAIAAAMSLPYDKQREAIASLGGYRSRGHGGKHRTANRTILGRWTQDRSKYMPAECQARGCR